MNFNQDNYKSLIKSFLKKGYSFIKFKKKIPKKNNVILRHDVDFDVNIALKMARLEKKMGICSTYFFLIRSNSYNLLEPSTIAQIKLIKQLGHEISIHFDPAIYRKNPLAGLKNELDLFKKLTGVAPKILSFHRPSKIFLNDELVLGMPHTYQNKYFVDIKYISDSGGGFFYDHPLETDAFKSNNSIQLLVHPIWWMTDGKNNLEKIKNYLIYKDIELSNHVAKNCKPWKHYKKTKKKSF